MKFSLFIRVSAIVLLLAAISGCGKGGCIDPNAVNYSSSANFDNGTCRYDGQVVFYFDLNAPNATVSINGLVDSISANYPNAAPTCGASGCATFTLPVGVYPFTASSALTSWNGNVTIKANQCTPQVLTQTTGAVTIWTGNNNSSLLPITVVFASQNGNVGLQAQITSAYSTSNPPTFCGAPGCANFNLLPGNYNYTASGGGINWNGSVIIVADGCGGEQQLQ